MNYEQFAKQTSSFYSKFKVFLESMRQQPGYARVEPLIGDKYEDFIAHVRTNPRFAEFAFNVSAGSPGFRSITAAVALNGRFIEDYMPRSIETSLREYDGEQARAVFTDLAATRDTRAILGMLNHPVLGVYISAEIIDDLAPGIIDSFTSTFNKPYNAGTASDIGEALNLMDDRRIGHFIDEDIIRGIAPDINRAFIDLMGNGHADTAIRMLRNPRISPVIDSQNIVRAFKIAIASGNVETALFLLSSDSGRHITYESVQAVRDVVNEAIRDALRSGDAARIGQALDLSFDARVMLIINGENINEIFRQVVNAGNIDRIGYMARPPFPAITHETLKELSPRITELFLSTIFKGGNERDSDAFVNNRIIRYIHPEAIKKVFLSLVIRERMENAKNMLEYLEPGQKRAILNFALKSSIANGNIRAANLVMSHFYDTARPMLGECIQHVFADFIAQDGTIDIGPIIRLLMAPEIKQYMKRDTMAGACPVIAELFKKIVARGDTAAAVQMLACPAILEKVSQLTGIPAEINILFRQLVAKADSNAIFMLGNPGIARHILPETIEEAMPGVFQLFRLAEGQDVNMAVWMLGHPVIGPRLSENPAISPLFDRLITSLLTESSSEMDRARLDNPHLQQHMSPEAVNNAFVVLVRRKDVDSLLWMLKDPIIKTRISSMTIATTASGIREILKGLIDRGRILDAGSLIKSPSISPIVSPAFLSELTPNIDGLFMRTVGRGYTDGMLEDPCFGPYVSPRAIEEAAANLEGNFTRIIKEKRGVYSFVETLNTLAHPKIAPYIRDEVIARAAPIINEAFRHYAETSPDESLWSVLNNPRVRGIITVDASKSRSSRQLF